MNIKRFGLLAVGMIFLALGAGCAGNKPLPLQNQFAGIIVSQTNSTQVQSLLAKEGMLSGDNAVSVFNQHGYSRELGLVRFDPDDLRVQRKDYIQVRSSMKLPPFTREKLNLLIQTVVPEEVLNASFENNMPQSAAVLQYCRQQLISDAGPFEHDQQTFGLVGMARSALQEAHLQLTDRPRDAHQLLTENGFTFQHTVFGKSRLRLTRTRSNIFTLSLTVADWVDPFSTW